MSIFSYLNLPSLTWPHNGLACGEVLQHSSKSCFLYREALPRRNPRMRILSTRFVNDMIPLDVWTRRWRQTSYVWTHLGPIIGASFETSLIMKLVMIHVLSFEHIMNRAVSQTKSIWVQHSLKSFILNIQVMEVKGIHGTNKVPALQWHFSTCICIVAKITLCKYAKQYVLWRWLIFRKTVSRRKACNLFKYVETDTLYYPTLYKLGIIRQFLSNFGHTFPSTAIS